MLKNKDMVLWDFQGTIAFGKFEQTKKFTVVVFADKEDSSVGLAVQNDVILNYADTDGTKTGLNLLDISDFYGMCRPVCFYST